MRISLIRSRRSSGGENTISPPDSRLIGTRPVCSDTVRGARVWSCGPGAVSSLAALVVITPSSSPLSKHSVPPLPTQHYRPTSMVVFSGGRAVFHISMELPTFCSRFPRCVQLRRTKGGCPGMQYATLCGSVQEIKSFGLISVDSGNMQRNTVQRGDCSNRAGGQLV